MEITEVRIILRDSPDKKLRAYATVTFDNAFVVRNIKGIEITPEDPSFCSAQCYPVLMGGRLKAAIVLPLVENYPKNKMELIAPLNIKEALKLKTGDLVEVEVLLSNDQEGG